jgi:hypothetical protein
MSPERCQRTIVRTVTPVPVRCGVPPLIPGVRLIKVPISTVVGALMSGIWRAWRVWSIRMRLVFRAFSRGSRGIRRRHHRSQNPKRSQTVFFLLGERECLRADLVYSEAFGFSRCFARSQKESEKGIIARKNAKRRQTVFPLLGERVRVRAHSGSRKLTGCIGAMGGSKKLKGLRPGQFAPRTYWGPGHCARLNCGRCMGKAPGSATVIFLKVSSGKAETGDWRLRTMGLFGKLTCFQFSVFRV